MAKVFTYTLHLPSGEGFTIDCTPEELKKRGYEKRDIVKEELLYDEDDEVLSKTDITNLIDLI